MSVTAAYLREVELDALRVLYETRCTVMYNDTHQISTRATKKKRSQRLQRNANAKRPFHKIKNIISTPRLFFCYLHIMPYDFAFCVNIRFFSK